jgi:hypothetical protein
MSLAATFLGGAKDRLLPSSIPFRYFTAAVGFHVLAWVTLFIGAGELADYSGGPGFILAALHLLTLGVLVMTVMGASFQLLPVATRQPLEQIWPTRIAFWMFAPGTGLLALGMIDLNGSYLYFGAGGVSLGLLIFAVLTALNLRRASGMKIVAVHGWASLLALIVFVSLGLSLIADFRQGFLDDREMFTLIHMVAAIFGFMGMLVFGFSFILIPMFVLSRNLPIWPSRLEAGLSFVAVFVAILSLYLSIYSGIVAAILLGLAACSTYLWLMRSAFQTRMRKRLGLSFVLIRISWGLMFLALLIGLAVFVELPIPNGMVLFVFVVLVGWMLTFLTGILQRIMPFLASMHAKGKSGKPLLISELTQEGLLKVHAICHSIAFIFCCAGIVLDETFLIQIGALLGVSGAIAFAGFAGFVVFKVRKAPG